MCQRWAESFDSFMVDMGHRPSDQHSIERSDVNGNYEPGNCYWATPIQQASNRRDSVLHEYQGEMLTVYEIARRLGKDSGIYPQLLSSRIQRGYTVEEAIASELGVVRRELITYNGETKSIFDWAKALGISYYTLYARLIDHNWPVEKAFTEPVAKVTARVYTHDGVTKSLSEWAQHYGIKYDTLLARISKGRSFEEAIAMPRPKGTT